MTMCLNDCLSSLLVGLMSVIYTLYLFLLGLIEDLISDLHSSSSNQFDMLLNTTSYGQTSQQSTACKQLHNLVMLPLQSQCSQNPNIPRRQARHIFINLFRPTVDIYISCILLDYL